MADGAALLVRRGAGEEDAEVRLEGAAEQPLRHGLPGRLQHAAVRRLGGGAEGRAPRGHEAAHRALHHVVGDLPRAAAAVSDYGHGVGQRPTAGDVAVQRDEPAVEAQHGDARRLRVQVDLRAAGGVALQQRVQAAVDKVPRLLGLLEQQQRLALRRRDARLPEAVDHSVVHNCVGLAAAAAHALEHGERRAPLAAAVARVDQRREGDDVGAAALRAHRLKQLQRLLPLRTLRARLDERVVGDGVGRAAVGAHLGKQVQRPAPLAHALAGRDERGVGDHGARVALGAHLLERLHRAVQLPHLAVRGDERVVRGGVGAEAVRPHPLVQRQRLARLPADVARDHHGVVRAQDGLHAPLPHDL
mmetsp:Transcript_3237/g.8116  ORF Transcript_3237/g.8116 Transcript_3237/m.8116 type:complete len:360 (-) Transcript_3237:1413-2492(-)